MRVAILGITYNFCLDTAFNQWDCEEIAFARAMGWELYELIWTSSDNVQVSNWPNKYLISDERSMAEAVSFFDLIIVPTQATLAKPNSHTAQALQFLAKCRQLENKPIGFCKDARPKFSQILLELGFSIESSYKPTVRSLGHSLSYAYIKHQMLLLPGHFQLGKEQKLYDFTFTSAQMSEHRQLVLRKYMPIADYECYGIGNTEPCLKSLTNGELQFGNGYMALEMSSKSTLLHIEPCLAEHGGWLTPRIATAFKAQQLLLVPIELEPLYSELLPNWMFVSDSAEVAERIMRYDDLIKVQNSFVRALLNV